MPKRLHLFILHKGPSIKDVRSQGVLEIYPLRTFAGKGGGLFRCGRPHF